MEIKKKEEFDSMSKDSLIEYVEELQKAYSTAKMMSDYYREDKEKLEGKLNVIYGVVELTKN